MAAHVRSGDVCVMDGESSMICVGVQPISRNAPCVSCQTGDAGHRIHTESCKAPHMHTGHLNGQIAPGHQHTHVWSEWGSVPMPCNHLFRKTGFFGWGELLNRLQVIGLGSNHVVYAALLHIAPVLRSEETRATHRRRTWLPRCERTSCWTRHNNTLCVADWQSVGVVCL